MSELDQGMGTYTDDIEVFGDLSRVEFGYKLVSSDPVEVKITSIKLNETKEIFDALNEDQQQNFASEIEYAIFDENAEMNDAHNVMQCAADDDISNGVK